MLEMLKGKPCKTCLVWWLPAYLWVGECLVVFCFFFPYKRVAALAKMQALNAIILHLCLWNPFPDQILTTTFIMINYCAQKIPSCSGGSNNTHWQLPGRELRSDCPSPWYIHQLRSPGVVGGNFFWSLPLWLLENAASESQRMNSVYSEKWMEMLLLFKTAI